MSVVPVTRGPGGRPAAVLKPMKREVRCHDAHDWGRYRDAIRQQEHGAPRAGVSGHHGRGGVRWVYKVPLRLEPQPEGGYTVTSLVLRGPVREGQTVAEALAHVAEALDLVLEDCGAKGAPLT